MMRNISILYMYKHALHDYNSYDIKATPNHTHHLTWPHPLPGLTTSELPEPPLYIPTSLPQEQAAKTDMLSVVSIQVLCTVEEGVANACI